MLVQRMLLRRTDTYRAISQGYYSTFCYHSYKTCTCPQGSQKFSSLKLLKIRKPSPIPDTSTPANHQKWLPDQILGGKTAKSIHKQLRYGR